MDGSLVTETPLPSSVTSPSVRDIPAAIENVNVAVEKAPSRLSTTSAVTAKSGRKRAIYRETPTTDVGRSQSRLMTPGGLVTEVSLSRHTKRDSQGTISSSGGQGASSAGKGVSSSRQLKVVDIDSTDLDTVIGDDESISRRLASLQDIDALSRHIYLRQCNQLGIVPISIVVRQLDKEQLNIRNRLCGPLGARALAVPLVYNKSIVTLDLSCNKLEDEGTRLICECLANHVSLRDLRLSENQLTIDGLKEIGRLVLMNTNITSLDISGNNFGDPCAKVLQKIIEESRTLKFLDLSDTNLGIESGIHLGQAIGSNESLEELRLCWNHIRRDGAEALTNGLRENVRLHRVDLSWNGFGQETAECLSKCFAENEALLDLDLAGNRLNDESMVILAKGLKQNDKLEKLVLIKNPITNVGAFALVAGVKENENSALQLLDIQDVAVRDDFLELLSDVQKTKDLDVLYNVHSLRAHILDPLDVLMAHIMEKGLDIESTFNLTAVTDDQPPCHTEKTHFITQLKKAGVPLNHSQLTQLAIGLLEEDTGLINLSDIIEAANDLQAETASALTSGTFDDMSEMDNMSVAPSDITNEPPPPVAPPKKPARKERSPIQAGQQYSW